MYVYGNRDLRFIKSNNMRVTLCIFVDSLLGFFSLSPVRPTSTLDKNPYTTPPGIKSLQCFALLFAHRHLKNYVWFCMFVTDPAKLSRIRTRSERIGNFEALTPNSHGTSGIG